MAGLDVADLSCRYPSGSGDVHALSGVSFSLDEGESVGIAGESACGKSTLGLSLIRMLQGGKITSGTVMFGGVPILGIPESDFDRTYRWKRISMIFQGAMNSLDPVFTVRDQFAEILRQHGFEGDAEEAVSSSLRSVHLDDSVLKKFPHELSGGMKQRVVIAMALLLRPEFVIADEPTTALDVLIQAQIINLLKDLKGEGMSFMLITHDLAVLSEIADKVGIMYAGQMVEFGSSEEVYGNPKHPYTQGLLASIPTLGGRRPAYIRGAPPGLVDPGDKCRFLDRCPHAFEKCHKDPPSFKTESGYVRCWLYDG